MFKKLMVPALIIAMLSGCAHTTPMPVALSQPGDEAMSCRTITKQMQDAQTQVSEADSSGNGQVAKNMALAVTGVFLIVPWFFMDTSDAHAVEAKAAQKRYDHLNDLAQDKNCQAAGTVAGVSTEPTVTAQPAIPASTVTGSTQTSNPYVKKTVAAAN